MTTIYTYNGQVIREASTGKWCIEAPPSIIPVTIGSQIWASKNLTVNDGQGGIYTNTVNYGQGNVTEYYYTWDAAVRVAATVQGWHLPTKTEWETLATTAGGTQYCGRKLKPNYGWTSGEGYNNYGFTALPAGWRNSAVESFVAFGTNASFWCSDEYSDTYSWYKSFSTSSQMGGGTTTKLSGFSIRLIKDAT